MARPPEVGQGGGRVAPDPPGVSQTKSSQNFKMFFFFAHLFSLPPTNSLLHMLLSIFVDLPNVKGEVPCKNIKKTKRCLKS